MLNCTVVCCQNERRVYFDMSDYKKESVDKLNAGFNLSCNHIAVFKIMFTSIEKDGLDVFSE